MMLGSRLRGSRLLSSRLRSSRLALLGRALLSAFVHVPFAPSGSSELIDSSGATFKCKDKT
jgi:hypothetical protein